MEEIFNSLPEPMQINSSLLIIAAIFLILIAVLNNFIFKPLVAVLDERKKQIQAGSRARDKSLKTVADSLAAYKAAHVEARRKAQSKRQQLLKESEMVRDEIIASSKERAMGMVQAAATELDHQVNQAKSSLKLETRAIAKKIVASVLSRNPA